MEIMLNGDPVEILHIDLHTERNDKYWILEIRLKSGDQKRVIYDIKEYRQWVRLNSRL